MNQELIDWNIINKVVAIVTDSIGSYVKLAVRIMDISHILCTAHHLNLIVQHH
jgi:hypothetical protein